MASSNYQPGLLRKVYAGIASLAIMTPIYVVGLASTVVDTYRAHVRSRRITLDDVEGVLDTENWKTRSEIVQKVQARKPRARISYAGAYILLGKLEDRGLAERRGRDRPMLSLVDQRVSTDDVLKESEYRLKWRKQQSN